MKNISLLIILCSMTFFGYASPTIDNIKLPDSINNIVHDIAKSKVFELSNQVGIAGTPSQQNLRFIQLKQLASVAQLADLTKNNQRLFVSIHF